MVLKQVFFDVTFLQHAKDLRGIPQVIFQLSRIFADDSRFADVIFISTGSIYKDYLSALGIAKERVREVTLAPWLGRFERFHGLFSTFRYRGITRQARLIIHPEPRTVLRSKVPQMVMYHDFIIFEPLAIEASRKWTRYFYCYYKYSRAAKVVYKFSNSDFTKRRALEFFPSIREDSIRVLHLGVREAVSGERPEKIPSKKRLQFLYVGSFDRRKNVHALLENLASVTGDFPFDFHLAGSLDSERRRELVESFARQGLPGTLHCHGLVSDAELKALYGKADFLLFPSLFEGFGIPIVEAMAWGLVVCAFRNSCIPEITGGNAILCDDNDFAGWGKMLKAMMETSGSYARMSRSARIRATYFSEAKMRERYSAYFLEVLGDGR